MATAQDFFIEVGLPGTATTLDSNYTAGDTSVTVVATTNWPSTDKPVIFAIDEATVVDGKQVQTAGTYNEFEGIVASATSISNVDQVVGSGDRNYSAGVLTRVYIPVTSERENRLVEGIIVEHNQDGTHSDITADSITTSSLTISGVASDGWTTTGGTHSVGTTYNSGNRSFEIDTSTDLTGFVSEGMRYRVTRNTTPPTQCADLESSSSQYASKTSPTGITFTDDFTIEAWIKPESYANGCIVSRWDGATGWYLEMEANGTIQCVSDNGAQTYNVDTYQSVPLDKQTHVAVSVDASADSLIVYLDGVAVPVNLTNGGNNSLTQAGNLQVGARNSTTFFDGKLADVRVWSDIRTATEIQDNMYGYPSDTTGLVAHFKLNGDFVDASTNGNDLTASGGALATNADNPWNATEYGIITNVTASTIQVFCPVGYGIPNETLTAPFYSTQSAPFGFPRDKGLWTVISLANSNLSASGSTTNTWYASNLNISIPVGSWVTKYEGAVGAAATSGSLQAYVTLSTASATESSSVNSAYIRTDNSSNLQAYITKSIPAGINVSSATTYYLNIKAIGTSPSALVLQGGAAGSYISAQLAYI